MQRNHTTSTLTSQKPKVNENQWLFISKALENLLYKNGYSTGSTFASKLLGYKLLLLGEQKPDRINWIC